MKYERLILDIETAPLDSEYQRRFYKPKEHSAPSNYKDEGKIARLNAGEIPMTLRGEGFETVEGFKTTAPSTLSIDAHVDYTLRLNSSQRIVLIADVFNLTNRQTATNYDNFKDQSFGTLNPNRGQPVNGGNSSTPSYQAPFALRLGARFEW